MTTIKDKLIIAIPKLPKQNSSKDLQTYIGTDGHNIAHVLYAMNRQGLVGFKINKQLRIQVVTNIKLTKQGEKLYQRMTGERP